MQAQQNAACHALHTVRSRLCRWMLQSQDMIGSDTFILTQEFLSHMLGVRRNTVSVEAHSVQQAGLIQYRRGHITILDRDGLEECACECYAVIRAETEKLMGTLKDWSCGPREWLATTAPKTHTALRAEAARQFVITQQAS